MKISLLSTIREIRPPEYFDSVTWDELDDHDVNLDFCLKFKMKDRLVISRYLGIDIKSVPGKITIDQEHYL